MVKKELAKKITAGIISLTVILLIFSVLMPPATSVSVTPGTPNKSSLTSGSTISFEDVNLTIRSNEKIPVQNLTFTIYDNNDGSIVAYVIFYPDGTEITDSPTGKFSVTNLTTILSDWYNIGYGYGYDEPDGPGYDFSYGYGYGYNDSLASDIIFLYDIVYTTHTTGTFYAKLAVNCSSHTYTSTASQTFTVSSSSGGSSTTPVTPEDEDETESTPEILVELNEAFDDILGDDELTESFYANDTDGDGSFDSFTDPNGLLNAIRFTDVNEHSSILISVNNNMDELFIWDAESNQIVDTVTNTQSTITSTETDTENNEVRVTVEIEKADWVYFEIQDNYPNYESYTVQTSDGRIIPADNIWRENGKIYVLDDPATTYIVSYNAYIYDIEVSVSDTTITPNTGLVATVELLNEDKNGLQGATLTYKLTSNGQTIWTDTTDLTPLSSTTQIISIPTTDLQSGSYTVTTTLEYGYEQTVEDTASFTIIESEEAMDSVPWIWVTILIVAAIIAAVGFAFIINKRQ